MPTPAGTGLTRRGVRRALARARAHGLRRRAGSTSSTRASPPPRPVPKNPILVTVFLQGGADALSLLYPAGDPLYRKLRPNLAVTRRHARSPRTTALFWHPALAPIAQLHGEGKVTVLPAVGYDHPDQSHFTSRHFWEVGATDPRLLTGWMGRYLDAVGTPDNPLQGLSLTGSLAAGARDREGAGRGDRRARPVRLLVARRLGRGRGPDARRDRRRSGDAGAHDPALAHGRERRRRRSTTPAPPARSRSAARSSTPAVAVPGRQRLVPAAACRGSRR